jgi:hypothetical protein
MIMRPLKSGPWCHRRAMTILACLAVLVWSAAPAFGQSFTVGTWMGGSYLRAYGGGDRTRARAHCAAARSIGWRIGKCGGYGDWHPVAGGRPDRGVRW